MPFTKEQKERIIQLYEPCNHNAAEISRVLSGELGYSISKTTILSHLKKEGYEINPNGGKRTPLSLPESALEKSLRSTTSRTQSNRSFKKLVYGHQLTRYWKQPPN